MKNSVFKQYYKRLAKEGWLKSALMGLIFAFIAVIITVVTLWICDAKNLLWLSAISGVAVFLITTPIFYYAKFKPNKKQLATRIDELGLEERVLTMTELEGDESFMAVAQRNDTMKALKTINAELLKFAVSAALIVFVAVTGVCAAGVTTAVAITDKKAEEVIGDVGQVFVPTAEYEVTYETEGEGVIEDDMFQVVLEGQDAEPVMAVAFDGWVFVEWSDGYEDAYRHDTNVIADMTVVAIFQEIEEGDGEGEGEGDGDGEADAPQDIPPEEGGDGEGEMESGEGAGGGEGGSSWKPSDMINDGETPYGGEYGNAVGESAGGGTGVDGVIGGYLSGIGGTLGGGEGGN